MALFNWRSNQKKTAPDPAIDDLEDRKSKAREQIIADNFDEAINLLVPDYKKVFWDLGEEFLGQGDTRHGFLCWQQAVTLLPNDQYLQIQLIRSLFENDEREKALTFAEQLSLSLHGADRSDFTAEEKMMFCITENIAIVTPEGAAALVRLTDYIVRNEIPGAFVECGVYKGGGVSIMLHALLSRGHADREFYLFDTFEGMPYPGELDTYSDGRSAHEEWQEKRRPDGKSGWVSSDLDECRSFIEKTGYPSEKLHFVKGMVEDTIPANAPEQIALLRLDTDFYTSTSHDLDHLYPRLSEGGVLLIDDYGAFAGSKIATDQFIERNNLKLMLHRVDTNVRVAIKN